VFLRGTTRKTPGSIVKVIAISPVRIKINLFENITGS